MDKIRGADFYQEKIELTTEQKKAWTQLVRAINKCKKEKIHFYQCMEYLGGLNGKNVRDVGDSIVVSCGKDKSSDAPNCLQHLSFPRVTTACSFADDSHFVLLTDEEW